jgi:hypothetical protein
MSVARPVAAGCPPGGTDRRRVSRGVSGGRTLAEVGGQPDCGHVRHATARSWRWLPGGPGLDARADEWLRRGGLLRHRIGLTEECGGGWIAGCRQTTPSVGASGLVGALLGGRVVPGGADRLAKGESLGTSCGGRVRQQEFKGHILLVSQN